MATGKAVEECADLDTGYTTRKEQGAEERTRLGSFSLDGRGHGRARKGSDFCDTVRVAARSKRRVSWSECGGEC